MGSATPSVESYHNAKTGKYGLAELNERFGGCAPAAIEIVDTKKVFTKRQNKGNGYRQILKR